MIGTNRDRLGMPAADESYLRRVEREQARIAAEERSWERYVGWRMVGGILALAWLLAVAVRLLLT
jgi:hypothetical protein